MSSEFYTITVVFTIGIINHLIFGTAGKVTALFWNHYLRVFDSNSRALWFVPRWIGSTKKLIDERMAHSECGGRKCVHNRGVVRRIVTVPVALVKK